jgi:hypothetical protein
MGFEQWTGYSGVYFNREEFLKFDKNYYLIGIISIVISLEFFFDGPEKSPKTPKPPFQPPPGFARQ